MYELKEVFKNPIGKILYMATCFGEASSVDIILSKNIL